jgi:hypothetical protein
MMVCDSDDSTTCVVLGASTLWIWQIKEEKAAGRDDEETSERDNIGERKKKGEERRKKIKDET